MKIPLYLSLLAAILLPQSLSAQAPNNNNNNEPEVQQGWRGYLSIQQKDGHFVMPYSRIVSVTRHEYLVDGGGKVSEVTIDTTGSVIARYYFLESLAGETSLNSGKIIDNRIREIENSVNKKTGIDTRPVIKHYPDTTHARTVEFNLSDKGDLKKIYDHIIHEWIEEGGRGAGRTLNVN